MSDALANGKTHQQLLDEVAKIAVNLEASTKVPAALTVAQWAVESDWGAKPVGKANYFGIKRAARHTQFCLVPTHEWFTAAQMVAWDKAHPDNPCQVVSKVMQGNKTYVLIHDEFADYSSLEESAEDYAWLISHGEPYAHAWALYQSSLASPLQVTRDSGFMVLAVEVLAVYATAAYSKLALTIANQANVKDAIARARSR